MGHCFYSKRWRVALFVHDAYNSRPATGQLNALLRLLGVCVSLVVVRVYVNNAAAWLPSVSR